MWRLWVVFLEHGGGGLGIFKSPVCTYNQAMDFSFSASHSCFSLLSKPSGRRMPPAERSALYTRIREQQNRHYEYLVKIEVQYQVP